MKDSDKKVFKDCSNLGPFFTHAGLAALPIGEMVQNTGSVSVIDALNDSFSSGNLVGTVAPLESDSGIVGTAARAVGTANAAASTASSWWDTLRHPIVAGQAAANRVYQDPLGAAGAALSGTGQVAVGAGRAILGAVQLVAGAVGTTAGALAHPEVAWQSGTQAVSDTYHSASDGYQAISGLTTQFAPLIAALTDPSYSVAGQTSISQIILNVIMDPDIAKVLKEPNVVKTLTEVLKVENKDVKEGDVGAVVSSLSGMISAVHGSRSFNSVKEDLGKQLVEINKDRERVNERLSKIIASSMPGSMGLEDLPTDPQEVLDRKLKFLEAKAARAYRDASSKLGAQLPQEMLLQEVRGEGALCDALSAVADSPIEGLVKADSPLVTAILGKVLPPTEAEEKAAVDQILEWGAKEFPEVNRDDRGRLDLGAQLKLALEESVKGQVPILRTRVQTMTKYGYFWDVEMAPKWQNKYMKEFTFLDCKLSGSFKGAHLEKCDFTGTKFVGDISFKGAEIDAETFKSMLPAIRQAKADGITVDLVGVDVIGDIELVIPGLGTALEGGGVIDPEKFVIPGLGKSMKSSPKRKNKFLLVSNSKEQVTDAYKDEVLVQRITGLVMAQVTAVERGWHGPFEDRAAIEKNVYEHVNACSDEEKQVWLDELKGSPASFLDSIQERLSPLETKPVELDAQGMLGCLTVFKETEEFQKKKGVLEAVKAVQEEKERLEAVKAKQSSEVRSKRITKLVMAQVTAVKIADHVKSEDRVAIGASVYNHVKACSDEEKQVWLDKLKGSPTFFLDSIQNRLSPAMGPVEPAASAILNCLTDFEETTEFQANKEALEAVKAKQVMDDEKVSSENKEASLKRLVETIPKVFEPVMDFLGKDVPGRKDTSVGKWLVTMIDECAPGALGEDMKGVLAKKNKRDLLSLAWQMGPVNLTKAIWTYFQMEKGGLTVEEAAKVVAGAGATVKDELHRRKFGTFTKKEERKREIRAVPGYGKAVSK